MGRVRVGRGRRLSRRVFRDKPKVRGFCRRVRMEEGSRRRSQVASTASVERVHRWTEVDRSPLANNAQPRAPLLSMKTEEGASSSRLSRSTRSRGRPRRRTVEAEVRRSRLPSTSTERPFLPFERHSSHPPRCPPRPPLLRPLRSQHPSRPVPRLYELRSPRPPRPATPPLALLSGR